MRLIPRVALSFALACAAVVLPASGASALPLGWPPCAYPEQNTANTISFELQQSGPRVAGGAVGAGAQFLTTCPGATYDFTFASAISDRKENLLPLGWTLTSATGGEELPASDDTLRVVRFHGDGFGRTFSIAATTSDEYYNKKLKIHEHCIEVSLTVTFEGTTYHLPQDAPAYAVCDQNGANSSFK